MTDAALPAMHEDATAQRLVRIGGWTTFAVGCAIALLLLLDPPVNGVHMALNFCAGLVGGVSLLLGRWGRESLAALVLVWGMWLVTSVVAMLNGGLRGPNMLTYPVLIVFSGWILGARATLWLSGMTGAMFLFFIWGDVQGWLPPARYGSRWAYLAYFLGIVGITTAATLLSRRSYQRRVDEAHRAAHFDALTGLPNRHTLMLRLRTLQGAGQTHALLLLNLDRFTTFNDARGNELGDRLLRAVALRLRGLMPGDGLLVRVAGDEFAIVLQNLGVDAHRAGRQALACADGLLQGLRQPLPIAREGQGDEGEEVRLTASVGITLYPQSGADGVDEALRRAGTALRQAKEQGGACVAFFERGMAEAAEQRFRTERELRHAVQAGGLRLYLQSQVNRAGRTIGAEALVRWQHPERGLVPPMDFIPVAEESDLIVALGDWVLAQACALLALPAWRERGLSLSVNVSARQFRDAGFVPRLQALLERTGASPARLTLEMTEGLVMDDFDDAVAKMHALAALGVSFALDDFGTGYSSLAYLKRLPIQELKIDKSFVQDVLEDDNDAALVEAIVRVADRFGLRVVAEGVETEGQADFLARHTPHMLYQGYLFGRPRPQEEWLAALTSR
ncbi:MAG: bifunctional diguanylate cyclase/phosphodiesterase [Acidovorax sp.]